MAEWRTNGRGTFSHDDRFAQQRLKYEKKATRSFLLVLLVFVINVIAEYTEYSKIRNIRKILEDGIYRIF